MLTPRHLARMTGSAAAMPALRAGAERWQAPSPAAARASSARRARWLLAGSAIVAVFWLVMGLGGFAMTRALFTDSQTHRQQRLRDRA